MRRSLLQNADSKLFIPETKKFVNYSEPLALSENSVFSQLGRQLVFCICDNHPDSLLGYMGLLAADAVPLVLGPTLSDHQLLRLVEIYRPRFAFLSTTRAEGMNLGKQAVAVGEYSLACLNNGLDHKIHESLSLLLSTSGSTGNPKFVRLSHENILSNAEAIAEYLEIDSSDRPITTLPASYTYGLSILHSHILKGATIALTNKTFFDRGFWDFLRESMATTFGGVPYHYEILKKLKFHRMDLPSLKTLTQAGGRMSPENSRDFATECGKKGIRFFTMYGQAEATARMSYLPHQHAVEKAGSIGRAIPGGEFWLEDEHGVKIESTGTTGELVYRGKNVCMGYAESYHDLALGDEFGGILKTGDLAYFDADGYFYISGRKKRFLKIFGHRINLQDIEDLLSGSGFSVACSGKDDLIDVYLIQRTAGDGLKVKEKLVAELKLAPGAVRVHGVAEFPRNEAGKIQYAQLASVASEVLA